MFAKYSIQRCFYSAATCYCCCCCCFLRYNCIMACTENSPRTRFFLQHSQVIVLSMLPVGGPINKTPFLYEASPLSRSAGPETGGIRPDMAGSKLFWFPKTCASLHIFPIFAPIPGRLGHVLSKLRC